MWTVFFVSGFTNDKNYVGSFNLTECHTTWSVRSKFLLVLNNVTDNARKSYNADFDEQNQQLYYNIQM